MPPITCVLFPDEHHVKTLKLEPAGAYTEDISYTWSEEPAGGYSRTTNPAFFVPHLVEFFDRITVLVIIRKAERGFHTLFIPYERGIHTPSIGLQHPAKRGIIPYVGGIYTSYTPYCMGIYALSLGHIKAIDALLIPYGWGFNRLYKGHSQGIRKGYSPRLKGLKTLSIPYERHIYSPSIPYERGISVPSIGFTGDRHTLIDIFNKKAVISRNNPTSNKFLLWEKN